MFFGPRKVAVWPAGLKIETPDQENMVLRTAFPDVADYHPELIDKIHRLAADPELAKQRARSLGGTKLYRLHEWDLPAADLLNARAMAFYRHAMKSDAAVIDISWANVYRSGDYVMPHSHVRSTASVVYMVDPGEPDPEDPNSGLFNFVDPRYPPCCKMRPDYMTTPLRPVMTAGTMIVFPSHLVHCVNPYTGGRPRITISWNINATVVPGSPLRDFTAT